MKKRASNQRAAAKRRKKGSAKKRTNPTPHRSIEAPTEYGFVSGDTPDPGPVDDGSAAEAKAGRLGFVWGAFKLGFGVALVLGASASIAWGAHRFALTTPRFAIGDIEVRGNQRYSVGAVGERAGIAAGDNIFALDVDRAADALVEDPWIQKARVSRQLPGTVRIDVVERQAKAVALIENQLYLVTPQGEPFKRVESGDVVDLPVITGSTGRGFAIDRDRETERLLTAIEVLKQYESMSLSRVRPAQEVHLGQDGTVVLVVGEDPTTLHLGAGPWRRKLLMAARVLSKTHRKGKSADIVFLDNEAHPERVVVRMR